MTLIADGTGKRRKGERGNRPAGAMHPMVVFLLDDRRFGIDLRAVERIVNADAVKPVPRAPAILQGGMRLRGRIVPVVNTRSCLDLPAREIRLGDQLIVLGRGERTAGLVADAVVGIIDPSSNPFVETREESEGGGCVRASVEMEGGVVRVCDLDRFFDLAEEGWAGGGPEEAPPQSK